MIVFALQIVEKVVCVCVWGGGAQFQEFSNFVHIVFGVNSIWLSPYKNKCHILQNIDFVLLT